MINKFCQSCKALRNIRRVAKHLHVCQDLQKLQQVCKVVTHRRNCQDCKKFARVVAILRKLPKNTKVCKRKQELPIIDYELTKVRRSCKTLITSLHKFTSSQRVDKRSTIFARVATH